MSRLFTAKHKPNEVTARVVEEPGYMRTSDGRTLWKERGQIEIVEGVKGRQYLIDGEVFLASYNNIPEDIKKLIESLNGGKP
jgi:hypothetical protein